MFPAEAKDYQSRLENHLRQNRPRQFRQMRKDGSLSGYVLDLGQQIAEWVNSQEPSEAELKQLPAEERQQARKSAFVMAESEALRELLPRRDDEENLIGPSGGYEDPPDPVRKKTRKRPPIHRRFEKNRVA